MYCQLPDVETFRAGINGKGKLARVIFTHLVCTKKSGVLGVQQNRFSHPDVGWDEHLPAKARM